MCFVFKKYTVFRWSLYGQLLALYYDISRLKYVIQLTTFSKLKGSPKKRDLPSKKKKKKSDAFDKDMHFVRMCRNFGSETSLDTTC